MNINKQNNNDEVEIDLRQILSVLVKKAFIIIFTGVMCAIIGFVISKFAIKPLYESATKLYVINRQDDSTTTLSDIQSSTQLTKDYKILVTSLPVMEAVIKELNLDMEPENLASSISVNTPTDTRVLEIIVTNHDAVMAKQIVDAVARVSSDKICEIMQIEKVNIIEAGNIAKRPVSPNALKNALIGGVIGLILACAIVIIKSLMDDRIRTVEDVERYLELSTLALIPISDVLDDGSKGGKNKNSKKKNK